MLLKYIKWNRFYFISLIVCIILSNILYAFKINLSWMGSFIIGGILAFIGFLLDIKYSRKKLK